MEGDAQAEEAEEGGVRLLAGLGNPSLGLEKAPEGFVRDICFGRLEAVFPGGGGGFQCFSVARIGLKGEGARLGLDLGSSHVLSI